MLSKKEYQNVKAFMKICKKYLPEDFKNSAEYIDSLFPPIEEEFDYEGIKHNRPSITSHLKYRVKQILYDYTNSSNVYTLPCLLKCFWSSDLPRNLRVHRVAV